MVYTDITCSSKDILNYRILSYLNTDSDLAKHILFTQLVKDEDLTSEELYAFLLELEQENVESEKNNSRLLN